MLLNKRRIKKAIRSPFGALILTFGYDKFKWVDDEIYLKIMFKYYIGHKLNLKMPSSYNEKLQWIKLYDRNPVYTKYVDKIAVRDFIADTLGKEYLIPLIGVWHDPDEIDFSALPDQFVLKCNHNSGTGMCICKDKSIINPIEIKENLRKGLKEDYFYQGREWPYKNVERKILCEKFMVDESGTELKDYKVMCFNGEPKLIELHMGRFTDHQTQDFYDINWKRTNITQGGISVYGASTTDMPKPDTLDKMLEFSRILSKGIPHVRIDWYSINGKLFFGEMTFFDGSGFDPYDKYEDDLLLGSWINLPKEKQI